MVELEGKVYDGSVRTQLEKDETAHRARILRSERWRSEQRKSAESSKSRFAITKKAVEIQEIGTVLSTGDGIARIYGLDKVAAGELLEFPHDIFGIALNLEEDNVGAALFGETHMIKEGDTVKRTGRIAEVPVGKDAGRTRGRTRWASRSTAAAPSIPKISDVSKSRRPASSRANR